MGNVEVQLVSLDDLILTKEASGRPTDISDVEMLKKAKKHREAQG